MGKPNGWSIRNSKPTGFMEYPKKNVPYRSAIQRLGDFEEIFTEPHEDQ